MRSKEDAHDYRYFPDPDLLPLHTADILARVTPSLPELPHQKRTRFTNDYGCSAYDADVLASEQSLAAYYEAAVAAQPTVAPKKLANWVLNDLLGALNDASLTITDCPLPATALAQLVAIVESGKISGSQGKEVFAAMLATPGTDPEAIIKEKGFEQVSDTGALEAMVDEILAANPDKVAEVKSGNEKAMNWFTGQLMKASKGKANPKILSDLLRSKLL
jgi:aspartyl-tRNA(Asn)/glutamyl-tRNA(Gln) amidotransferase subunit B